MGTLIYKIIKMGNICGAAPSKDNMDQPIDRKSEQKKQEMNGGGGPV